ncbi:MAG: CHAT domain-containing protein [bacterium]
MAMQSEIEGAYMEKWENSWLGSDFLLENKLHPKISASLYRNILAENRKPGQMLEISERLKGRNLLDLYQQKRIPLNNENHVIALYAYRDSMNLIQQASAFPCIRDSLLTEAQSMGETFRIMWKNNISDLDKPGLLRMMKISALDLRSIQDELREDQSVIYNWNGDSAGGIILISRSSTEFYPYLFPLSKIRLWTNELNSKVDSGLKLNECQQEIDSLSAAIFSGCANRLEDFTMFTIIHSPITFSIPFQILKINGTSVYEMAFINECASLAGYSLHRLRRNVNTMQSVVVSLDTNSNIPLKIGKQSVINWGLLKDKTAALDDAAFIHLDVPINPDSHNPFLSTIGNQPYMPIYQLHAWDLRANLVSLRFNRAVHGISLLTMDCICNILGYAGVPSILVSLWNAGSQAESLFYHVFFDNLDASKQNDVKLKTNALNTAIQAVKEKYPAPLHWAGFRLWGYEGMNRTQRTEYARIRLENNFKSAIIETRKGDMAEDKKKQYYRKALKYLYNTLEMESELRLTKHLAPIYQQIATILEKLERFDEAIVYTVKLKSMVPKNSPAEAQLENYLSKLSQLNGDIKASLYHKERVREIEKNSPLKTALSYSKSGEIIEASGDYNKALDYYESSKSIYDEEGFSQGVVVNLHNELRIHLQKRNDYYKAMDIAVKCHTILSEEFKHDTLMAHTLRLWGLCMEKQGKYNEANNKYSQAIAMYDKINMDSYSLLTLNYIANCLWYMGNYKDALKTLNGVIEKAGQSDNVTQLILGNGTLGLIYNSLGETQKALISEQKAMNLAAAAKDSVNLAGIYNNIGMILMGIKEYGKSKKHFLQAVSIDKKLKSQAGLAVDYKNLGELYLEMNSPGADSAFSLALTLAEKINDPFVTTQALKGLGEISLNKSELSSARDFFLRAQKVAENSSLMDQLWIAKYRLAQVYEREDNFDEALDSYKASIRIIEGMRSGFRLGGVGSGFLKNKMAVYSGLVDLLTQLGRDSEAFEFVERARARSFMDMMGNKKPAGGKKGPSDLMENEAALQDSIRMAVSELWRIKAQSNGADKKKEAAAVQERVNTYRARHQEVLTRLKQENAELASLVSVDPLSLKEIQKKVPAAMALMEYFITKKRVYIWVIKSDTLNAVKINIPESLVEKTIRMMRQSLEELSDVSIYAKELYKILIEPAEMHFTGIKSLCIIPHGALHYLPFAALLGPKGYLLDSYNLVYNISASVFVLCGLKVKSGFSNVLAFGNPELNSPDTDLPFAEREVRSLERTFSHVKSYLNRVATESIFKKIDKNYGIIHFACHGEFEETSPMYSGLLLASDTLNDGRLEVHEIFDLQINSDLVLLSACQTGLGKVTSGDDLIGLTSSFIYAGARSVISSLWRVDDVATAVMTKRFYRYSKDKQKPEALRMAQLFVKNSINDHPAYWAAFKISGAN